MTSFGGGTASNDQLSGAGAGAGMGGAVFARNGSVTFVQCSFETNSATGGKGGDGILGSGSGGTGMGGGLFCYAATVAIDHCAWRENVVTGAQGGAIGVAGGEFDLENCTLSGNQAQGEDGYGGGFGFPDGYVGASHGGGLAVVSQSGQPEPLARVRFSTISGNHPGWDLGAYEFVSVLPLAPRVAARRLDLATGLELTASGEPGTTYTLEFSNELLRWTPLGDLATGGTFRHQAEDPAGFYRLKSQR